ncbi:hypothetical protein P8452_13372 [Trifolium repens]|nr:hypothetical protein P8452_13372 [Trifolium repens]
MQHVAAMALLVHLRRSSPSAAAGAHPFPCRKDGMEAENNGSYWRRIYQRCLSNLSTVHKSLLQDVVVCSTFDTNKYLATRELQRKRRLFQFKARSQVRLVFVNRENDIILLDDDDPWQFRWINYLEPDIKRGHFTNEEEENIIKLHEMLGNSS